MKHFIAYHSVERMGYLFEHTEDLNFLSTKKALLTKAQGNFVWCIQGISGHEGTEYSLCGVYVAGSVEEIGSGDFIIHGPCIKDFSPPIFLNAYEWFPALRKSQGNFGLGFNHINDALAIGGLEAIAQHSGKDGQPLGSNEVQDTDPSLTTNEGVSSIVSHLKRERNRLLIKAKKAVTLKAKGNLKCEVCNFDFAIMYGAIGLEYCEVHHLRPLSTYDAEKGDETTLSDLAIVCSNCHRMIHRHSPMLSTVALAAIIQRDQS
jgi:hypothetical protein